VSHVEEGAVRRMIRCDCGFEAVGDGDDELVEAAQAHARKVHGADISPEAVLRLARASTSGTDR
jgi:predicted small metal-binding protein